MALILLSPLIVIINSVGGLYGNWYWKNLVEFKPENADEDAKPEALWKIVVDCIRFHKKLLPVGEYVPAKSDAAWFMIEGVETADAEKYPDVRAGEDCRAYCQTCNKFVELKPPW